MHCTEFQQAIDDYLDQAVAQTVRQAMDEHLLSCAACSAKLTHAQRVMSELKQFSVPPMPPGFAQRAIKQAVTQRQHHRRGFIAGFSTAIAASLALALFVSGVLPIGQPGSNTPFPGSMPEIALSVEQVQTISLVFDSAVAVANAELTLNLPDHVELSGYPGQHSLTWTTSLKQGRNVLSLPLKGLSQTKGELVAQINANGKVKSIHVPLQIKDRLSPQASRAQIVTT